MERSAQSAEVATSRLSAELPAAYETWRRSRLGRITDELEERLLLDSLGSVQGLSVLDVGCGDGVLAAKLSRRGARVTGLDPDPEMLAAADHRARNDSIQLNLVRGRAQALPFSYPPFGIAARLFARFDRWFGRRTTVGAAFLVVRATKGRSV